MADRAAGAARRRARRRLLRREATSGRCSTRARSRRATTKDCAIRRLLGEQAARYTSRLRRQRRRWRRRAGRQRAAGQGGDSVLDGRAKRDFAAGWECAPRPRKAEQLNGPRTRRSRPHRNRRAHRAAASAWAGGRDRAVGAVSSARLERYEASAAHPPDRYQRPHCHADGATVHTGTFCSTTAGGGPFAGTLGVS